MTRACVQKIRAGPGQMQKQAEAMADKAQGVVLQKKRELSEKEHLTAERKT
jgi:hypothetical protein